MKRLTKLIVIVEALLIVFTASVGMADQTGEVKETKSIAREEFLEYIGSFSEEHQFIQCINGQYYPDPGITKFFILSESIATWSATGSGPRTMTEHSFTLEGPKRERCTLLAHRGPLEQRFLKYFRRASTSSTPEMQALKVDREKAEQEEARRRVEDTAARARAEAEAKAARAAAAARSEKMRQDAEARSALFPVIREWFTRANAGRYSQLPALCAPDSLQQLAARGIPLRTLADRSTRNGTIARLEFVSEEVRGEGAVLRYRVFFKNGATEEDTTQMVLQRGTWLLDVR